MPHFDSKESARTPTFEPIGGSAAGSIAGADSGITAFVGRTLRGPLHRPVTVHSFAEFEAEFGGLWQPSPLSYAIDHYFEHGGRQAIVVRVANGATPATLSLPCGRETLRLVALNPGSREFLRAAVDYDHVAGEPDQFNLVIQRVRAPGSERVDAQEIYRRLSVRTDAESYVGTVLASSRLVRLHGNIPAARPDRTPIGHMGADADGYCCANPDGSDGLPLADYDVIGSARDRTGLFALDAAEPFDFLYLPPLSRDVDIGPSALVAGARYCRDRRALLIVDPPRSWKDARSAMHGLRQLQFSTPDACMFFPRIVTLDRLRGQPETFGNGGAVAGMLSRATGQRPAWSYRLAEPELLLRPGFRPACAVAMSDRWRLAANGINTVQAVRAATPLKLVQRTLAGGSSAAADWGYIGARRFALHILRSVEIGTRWAGSQASIPATWNMVRRQVAAYLERLAGEEAFVRGRDSPYFVICDERTNSNSMEVSLLIGFAVLRPDELRTFQISHAAAGTRVREVSVNPLEYLRSADLPDPAVPIANVVGLAD